MIASLRPPPHAVVAFALASAVAAAAQPGADRLDEAVQREIRAARTVQVEIKQTYDFSRDDEMEEDKPERREDQSTRDFLPLLDLTTQIVKRAGWRLADRGAAPDLTLRVEVEGRALSGEYAGPTIFGRHYSGASLGGTAVFERSGRELASTDIFAEKPVQYSITRYYSSPRSAPFDQTLGGYCEDIWILVGRALGPAPLVNGLSLENWDLRASAARSLVRVGDSSCIPAMVALLGQDSVELGGIAALGLGVFGDSKALAPLFAALRNETVAAPADGDDGDEHYVETSKLAVEAPADRRDRAIGLIEEFAYDRRKAILWALMQIDAPEKSEMVLAALRDRTSTSLREGAAVILGGRPESGSRDALLAAISDPEPAVRLAVVEAVGNEHYDEVVEALLKATLDPHGGVRGAAREALRDHKSRRWDAFLAGIQVRPGDQAGYSAATAARALGSVDPLVRYAALERTNHLDESGYRTALHQVARGDPWPFLRLEALKAVEDRNDDETIQLYIAVLGDREYPVRRRAALALAGEAGQWERATPAPLPESVLEPAVALLGDADGETAGAAVKVIKRIRSPRVADALREVARKPGAAHARGLAIATLVETSPSGAWPLLVELAGPAGEEAIDDEVCNGLIALGHPATLDPLIAQLKSNEPRCKRVAARALGGMRQPRAVGPLIAALQSSEMSDVSLADVARESLRQLTGASFHSAEEWKKWWKENAARLR